jgi:Transposon-encoded protein TnpV
MSQNSWRQATDGYIDAMAQRYAQEHLKFLQENNTAALEGFRQSGDLNSYLSSVGQQASDRFQALMMQHNNSPAVQKLPHQDRTRDLQSRRREVEEIVQHDVINQPLPSED